MDRPDEGIGASISGAGNWPTKDPDHTQRRHVPPDLEGSAPQKEQRVLRFRPTKFWRPKHLDKPSSATGVCRPAAPTQTLASPAGLNGVSDKERASHSEVCQVEIPLNSPERDRRLRAAGLRPLRPSSPSLRRITSGWA